MGCIISDDCLCSDFGIYGYFWGLDLATVVWGPHVSQALKRKQNKTAMPTPSSRPMMSGRRRRRAMLDVGQGNELLIRTYSEKIKSRQCVPRGRR